MNEPSTATAQAGAPAIAPESNGHAASPGAYFARARQAFELAAANTGAAVERDFLIGGHGVRLRFAGQGWLPGFTAALEHRAAQLPGPPDVTICLWDDATTGAQMPEPPWSRDEYTPRGDIPRFNDERYRAAYQRDAGLLSLLDARAGLALIWTPKAARLPRYELTFPARSVLYWWLQARGLQLVHGGAVGTDQGGVLLVGKGGSGKSTTALACLHHGMRYAGDDYVLVTSEPRPTAHSVYSSGKLHADHIQRLPFLLPLVTNGEHLQNEKALLLLNEHYGARLAPDLPLSAIVLPRVTGQPATTFRRISGARAMTALAPSTLLQLPGAGSQDYENMGRLARRLPAYSLELGQDLDQLANVVQRLIADTVEEPAASKQTQAARR